MNKQAGFTVIEVLIASFILFLVISSASLIFSSTVKSKQSATQSLLLYSYVPVLMDHIEAQIQYHDNMTSGKGYFMGVNYTWRAAVSERKPVDFEQGVGTTPTNEALLWKVILTVSVDRKSENFDFSVVSWQRF